MTYDELLLLKLVRVGLGDEALLHKLCSSDLDTSSVDWDALLDLACDQGIPAVAAIGLQSLSDRKIALSLDSAENEQFRYDWFGQMLRIEAESSEYLKSLAELVRRLNSAGIGRVMVIKGYGMSLNYPDPMSRSFGDIDIYVLDGKQMEAERVLSEFKGYESAGSGKIRHSHALINSIPIENHFFFTSGNFPGLEELLQKEAMENATSCKLNGVDIYLPSDNFNAVFLIWHMANHFGLENNNLRQLCDLFCFLRNRARLVDWQMAMRLLKEARCYRFACVVLDVMVDYFGLDSTFLPKYPHSILDEHKYMDFVLNAPELKTDGIEAVLKYWRRRWNFRLAKNRWWLSELLCVALSHLIKK